jgi:hypothetical protein
MIEREYEYRLKAGRVETRALLFGAGALFMAYMGLTNDRGLILFVIPLSQANATIAYWVFAGLAACICAVDSINVERRGHLRQRIALTKDGLLVPKSQWTEEEQKIPYESILKLTPFDGPDSLVIIRHQMGEFTLRLDMLPDERAYAEIVGNVSEAARIAQGRTATLVADSATMRNDESSDSAGGP